MKQYDVIVLGSGEGGKYIAWTLAKQGQKVAVIERKYIGGSCPNIACLPSKNIIHSAKVASYFSRSEEFGISKDKFAIDILKVRERKRKMIDGLIDLHLEMFQKSGAELILGDGKFLEPKIVEVISPEGITQKFQAEKFVLSTGSRALIDESIPGLQQAQPMTHIELLELDHIPEHLIVIGGGYIGLELAQAMRRLGSRVTILEHNSHIIHREDEDVSSEIEALLKDEGISILTEVRVLKVDGKSGEKIKLHLTQNKSDFTLEGTDLLVSTGRKPNTENLGLEKVGVELTEKGFIKVNEHLETTAKNIWAVGDCAGSPQFTHIAFDDFRIVVDRLNGLEKTTKNRQVPFCLFTDPELARVGLSESEAKKRGVPYRLAKIPMTSVLRTRTLSETKGFMKVLIDVESDHILGFTVLGVGGGEIMATVQLAMLANLPYTILRDAIFTHPTLIEGLIPLFSKVQEKP